MFTRRLGPHPDGPEGPDRDRLPSELERPHRLELDGLGYRRGGELAQQHGSWLRHGLEPGRRVHDVPRHPPPLRVRSVDDVGDFPRVDADPNTEPGPVKPRPRREMLSRAHQGQARSYGPVYVIVP